jgi:aldehyde dehydrogenase (NAD+)
MTTAPTLIEHRQHFIGGEWVDPSSDGTIEVVNASTEEVMGRIPEGTPEDVDRAVAAARAAFETWSQTPVEERVALTAAVGLKLQERQEELAALISQELGSPITFSMTVQTGLPIMDFSSMAHLVEHIPWEQQLGNSLIVREPIGVVGAIRSPRGTTRCTRSARRWRRRWWRAARSC